MGSTTSCRSISTARTPRPEPVTLPAGFAMIGAPIPPPGLTMRAPLSDRSGRRCPLIAAFIATSVTTVAAPHEPVARLRPGESQFRPSRRRRDDPRQQRGRAVLAPLARALRPGLCDRHRLPRYLVRYRQRSLARARSRGGQLLAHRLGRPDLPDGRLRGRRAGGDAQLPPLRRRAAVAHRHAAAARSREPARQERPRLEHALDRRRARLRLPRQPRPRRRRPRRQHRLAPRPRPAPRLPRHRRLAAAARRQGDRLPGHARRYRVQLVRRRLRRRHRRDRLVARPRREGRLGNPDRDPRGRPRGARGEQPAEGVRLRPGHGRGPVAGGRQSLRGHPHPGRRPRPRVRLIRPRRPDPGDPPGRPRQT